MSTTSLMPSSESDIRDLLISETEGFWNPNNLINSPNGWETHFIIGQQF